VLAREDKPAMSNLLTIFSVVAEVPVHELESRYEGKGYGDFKKDLAEAVVEFLRPLQQRTAEIMDDRAGLLRTLETGAAKAQSVAAGTLAEVREKVGFLPRS